MDILKEFDEIIPHSRSMPEETSALVSQIQELMTERLNLHKWIPFGSVHAGIGIEGESDWDYLAVIPKEEFSFFSSEPIWAVRRLEAVLSDLCHGDIFGHLDPPAFSMWHKSFPNIKIDVVPALSRMNLRDDKREWSPEVMEELKETLDCEPYFFPGTPKLWYPTWPESHSSVLDTLDKNSAGFGRPIIRLLKAWKKNRAYPIRSFYLEVFVLRWFQNTIDVPGDLGDILETVKQKGIAYQANKVSHLAEGFEHISEALWKHLQNYVDTDKIPSLADPLTYAWWHDTPASSMVYEIGFMLSRMAEDLEIISRARQAEINGNTEAATELWNNIFFFRVDNTNASSEATNAAEPTYENLKRAKSLNDKAVDLTHEGKFEEAVEVFDEALALWPSCIDALYNKGASLLELKQLEEADTIFNKVTKLNPEYADGFFGKGNVCLDSGKYQEAVLYFDRAIEKAAPADWRKSNYWYNKGLALRRLGFDHDAEQCFKISEQYE